MLRTLKKLALLLALCGLCLPSAIYAAMKAARFPLAWSVPALPERAVVDNSPDGRFSIYRYIHEMLPPKAVCLSFRPWDFLYYANRPLLHPDDPKMAAFYSSKTPLDAWRALAELGADYICLPSNALPLSAEKPVSWLASDPSLTELVFEKDYNRIYKILRVRCPVKPVSVSDPAAFDFSGGARWNMPSKMAAKTDGKGSVLINLSGEIQEATLDDASALFKPGDRCLLRGSISGSGQLSIVAISRPSGSKATIWSGLLSPSWQEISAQFSLPDKDAECALLFALGPDSSCDVKEMKIESYGKVLGAWRRTPSDFGDDPFTSFIRLIDSYKHALSNLM